MADENPTPIHAELHAHVRLGLRVDPVHGTGQVRVGYALDPEMTFMLLHTEGALQFALALISAVNEIVRPPRRTDR